MSATGLGALAVVFYLGAAGTLARHLVMRATSRRVTGLALATVACFFHAWLLQRTLFGAQGITLGLGGSLSLFAWQCAVLVVLAALLRPLESLGVIIFPLAGLCVIITGLLPADPDAVRGLEGPIQIHIVLSLLAYGLLTLSAVQALLLTLQDYCLRRHRHLAMAQKLPPLQTMERLLFQLMAVGWAALTLALVSGLLFAGNLLAQHLLHKTILSVAAWLVFLVLLWGRLRFGWRGSAAVRWTWGGYAALILAYFGSKMLLELYLGTHWR